jgi:hypothetical protein
LPKVISYHIERYLLRSGAARLTVNSALKNKARYFKEIDAILCTGLSHDDRCLLTLYKQSNPVGIIVVLDLQQPDY